MVATHIWPALRMLMAVTIIAAIAVQLSASIATAEDLDRSVSTVVANFLSFFTVLSNAMAAATLCWAAVSTLIHPGRTAQPPALTIALASVTTYMIVTGVVYNTLLRDVTLP